MQDTEDRRNTHTHTRHDNKPDEVNENEAAVDCKSRTERLPPQRRPPRQAPVRGRIRQLGETLPGGETPRAAGRRGFWFWQEGRVTRTSVCDTSGGASGEGGRSVFPKLTCNFKKTLDAGPVSDQLSWLDVNEIQMYYKIENKQKATCTGMGTKLSGDVVSSGREVEAGSGTRRRCHRGRWHLKCMAVVVVL